ncbi:MAG TPA: thioredoxin domain-containing protein [Solirubrobacteraceae bacterium]|nr:thioredoxin domain-containing protein [Solirubrobacteraceae bacterium]
MSSRRAERDAAREARLIAEARVRAEAARRRRLRIFAGTGLVAIALVAAAVGVSSRGGAVANAASGGVLRGAAYSARLFAGIPQRGISLGRPDAPVRMVEFADLQCPYCDEYALQALPTLVTDYVRTGRVQMQFENLSFIGPGSVVAGRVAAAAAEQNRLWNFVDLLYLNQGEENTGYVTPGYLHRLLAAVPGLDVPSALAASRAPAANAALGLATRIAEEDGVDGTPSFLVGRAGGPLRPLTPSSLTAGPFAAAIDQLLGAHR